MPATATQFNNAMAASPWTTPANVQSQVSNYPYWSSVTPIVTSATSAFPTKTELGAAVSPFGGGTEGQVMVRGATGAEWSSTLDIDSVRGVNISGSTIFASTIVAGTSVWVVDTVAPESVNQYMTGGNPVINTASKVFNLPTLTASSATPFYLFLDPTGSGVSIVVPPGAGSSLYVYDPVDGLPRYTAGETLWAHPGGGPGQQVSICPAYSGASGWYYNILGITGVSWQTVENYEVTTRRVFVRGKTWIGKSGWK
jgi:hypothetical protein